MMKIQGLSNGFSWSDGGATLSNSTQSGVVFNTHTGVCVGGGNSPPLNQTSEPGGFAITVDIPHSTQPLRVFVFLGTFTADATNLKQAINFSAALLDAAGAETASFVQDVRGINHKMPINPTGV